MKSSPSDVELEIRAANGTEYYLRGIFYKEGSNIADTPGMVKIGLADRIQEIKNRKHFHTRRRRATYNWLWYTSVQKLQEYT